MALSKVIGTKRQAAAFTYTLAGYGACVYHQPGPLTNLQDGAFHTILSLRIGDISGSLLVEFEFRNTVFTNAQSSKARLRVGDTTYPEMQTGTEFATYSQAVPVSPGTLIHLEVYCMGANSKTQVRNIRFCAATDTPWAVAA